jgi:hypothetical protein
MLNQFSMHVWKPGTQGEEESLRNLEISSSLIGANICATLECEYALASCG